MIISNCDYVVVSYDVSDMVEDMRLKFKIYLSNKTINTVKLLHGHKFTKLHIIGFNGSVSQTRMVNGFITPSYMMEYDTDFGEEINYLIPMSLFKEILDYRLNGLYLRCGDNLPKAIDIAVGNNDSSQKVREFHTQRLTTWLTEFSYDELIK